MARESVRESAWRIACFSSRGNVRARAGMSGAAAMHFAAGAQTAD
jgi:hypothetical protein